MRSRRRGADGGRQRLPRSRPGHAGSTARRRLDLDTGRYRRLSRSQKLVNAAHARRRGPGERANAQIKSWKILREIRCCPYQATSLVNAILVVILAS